MKFILVFSISREIRRWGSPGEHTSYEPSPPPPPSEIFPRDCADHSHTLPLLRALAYRGPVPYQLRPSEL